MKIKPTDMKRERASVTFSAIQDSDLEQNSFRGMASVFGNMIDTWTPTRILPGAFTKTLSENLKRIKVLYQHNQDWPIGVPTRMEETSDGLLVEARVSLTSMGNDVLTLIRDGVLTELSIGFDPVKFQMVDEGGNLGLVRHIQECRLWEFSPVTFAANSLATINNIHSMFSALRTDEDVELTEEGLAALKGLAAHLRVHPDSEAADMMSYVVRDTAERHEGKVLSAKNKALVEDAIQALKKLVEAAEPPQSRALTAEVQSRLRDLNLLYADTLSV